jgi:(1->4)-alpha-D-glucan 1-alpha-D-glucosylmutase
MLIPRSTYRIQFNKDFTFAQAKEIVEYLYLLGISDLYASPIFKAMKGSMHGYDVLNPMALNPELGTDDEFQLLAAECKKFGMGWMQDIVPNHMAYSGDNLFLVDVLENGPSSRFYTFFDIEWNHPHASARQGILVPFLGKFFKEVLEAGEIQLKYDAEGFSVNYFEHRFPIKIDSYPEILSLNLTKLKHKLGKNDPDVVKYSGLLYILKSLSLSENIDERYSQIKFAKGLLAELYTANEQIKMCVNETLKQYNGDKNNPDSFTPLEKLLADQYYRLAYWKVAAEEINYRRFFNINELISLRMELEETFNRTHSFIVKLVKEERITSMRIDHVDGLYDPASYLKRLRERTKDAYIAVEKILTADEVLPDTWPVQGTTGYDFAAALNGLFVMPKNGSELHRIYISFSHFNYAFDRIVYEKKKFIIQSRMAGDVERLAFLVEAVSSKDRYGIDFTMHGLKRALEELLAHFPVYRTYINASDITDQDRKYIGIALKHAHEDHPRYENEFNYIGNMLLLNLAGHLTEDQNRNVLDFIMKFQQLTSPIMAKGVEDTAFYVYNRFLSLNEVGGSPAKFGVERSEFDEYMLGRHKSIPHTQNTTSTHDTKRGEDFRARLNVISEIPEEWGKTVDALHALVLPLRREVRGRPVPEANEEYFLYQTIAGSYPLLEVEQEGYAERLKAYLVKASREAAVSTAWIAPNIAYEDALTGLVDDLLGNGNGFINAFLPFITRAAYYGAFNSLSQVLIKATSVGVPDFYQGSELWEYSMVDPDNRRPVDYARRKAYLTELLEEEDKPDGKYVAGLLSDLQSGKIKMFLMHRALRVRNAYSALYEKGTYEPIVVSGASADNIIAFVRRHEAVCCVTAAPRFLSSVVDDHTLPIGEVWNDTRIQLPLEIRQWRNAITGATLEARGGAAVSEIFREFPGAILIGSSPEYAR